MVDSSRGSPQPVPYYYNAWTHPYYHPMAGPAPVHMAGPAPVHHYGYMDPNAQVPPPPPPRRRQQSPPPPPPPPRVKPASRVPPPPPPRPTSSRRRGYEADSRNAGVEATQYDPDKPWRCMNYNFDELVHYFSENHAKIEDTTKGFRSMEFGACAEAICRVRLKGIELHKEDYKNVLRQAVAVSKEYTLDISDMKMLLYAGHRWYKQGYHKTDGPYKIPTHERPRIPTLYRVGDEITPNPKSPPYEDLHALQLSGRVAPGPIHRPVPAVQPPPKSPTPEPHDDVADIPIPEEPIPSTSSASEPIPSSSSALVPQQITTEEEAGPSCSSSGQAGSSKVRTAGTSSDSSRSPSWLDDDYDWTLSRPVRGGRSFENNTSTSTSDHTTSPHSSQEETKGQAATGSQEGTSGQTATGSEQQVADEKPAVENEVEAVLERKVVKFEYHRAYTYSGSEDEDDNLFSVVELQLKPQNTLNFFQIQPSPVAAVAEPVAEVVAEAVPEAVDEAPVEDVAEALLEAPAEVVAENVAEPLAEAPAEVVAEAVPEAIVEAVAPALAIEVANPVEPPAPAVVAPPPAPRAPSPQRTILPAEPRKPKAEKSRKRKRDDRQGADRSKRRSDAPAAKIERFTDHRIPSAKGSRRSRRRSGYIDPIFEQIREREFQRRQREFRMEQEGRDGSRSRESFRDRERERRSHREEVVAAERASIRQARERREREPSVGRNNRARSGRLFLEDKSRDRRRDRSEERRRSRSRSRSRGRYDRRH